ncbi:MAG: ECF-type sigma factor [Pseudomonadota bacterium]
MGEVTVLLRQWQEGDQAALSPLTELVYEDLRRRASMLVSRSSGLAISLEPPELVNECFLKLTASESRGDWRDRAHFLAVAARAMRQILVDQFRYQSAGMRAGQQVTLQTDHLGQDTSSDLFELDRALERLAELDSTLADLVEMKFFAGMSIAELALATGRSEPTVKRQWRAARVWLARYFDEQHDG